VVPSLYLRFGHEERWSELASGDAPQSA